jgi:hypothetical protein
LNHYTKNHYTKYCIKTWLNFQKFKAKHPEQTSKKKKMKSLKSPYFLLIHTEKIEVSKTWITTQHLPTRTTDLELGLRFGGDIKW